MTLLNGTMTPIQTVTIGAGGQAAIEFTSIPQTYTDLVIKLSVRSSDTQDTGNVGMNMRINAATTGYSGLVMYGYGSTVGSYASNTQSIGTIITGGAGVTSMFSNSQVHIPNYADSNAKSYSVDGVATINSTTLSESYSIGKNQSSTSAISSLTFTCSSGNFVQYSTATLYGIQSVGTAAKATGGIITQDADYFYHTFLASGTFTPTSNITADYLVVAGGGGGGRTNFGGYGVGAGGGGGGVKTATSQALTSNNNYTVTVGAGGAGGGGSAGSNGSSTIFSGTGITTLTATGGQTVGTSYAGGTSGADSSNAGGGGGPTSSGSTETYAGGGGGGSGGVGGSWNSSTTAGNGGAGTANAYSGSSVNYGGGGGGGYGRRTSSAATGTAGTGTDGGGNGTNANNTTGGAGTANRGGGGGGAGTLDAGTPTSGAGGSGIVIIRYAK
jgi:hypothetical protein